MKSVLVFCSSSDRVAPMFFSEMEVLAQGLASRVGRVVYGGACCGLMGCLADGVLNHGGEVIGVLPKYLNRAGVVHESLTELRLIDNLMDRKRMMLSLSDSVIVFPGGIGTLDEFTEVLSLKQLGEIDLPVYVLNAFGFFDPMIHYFKELQLQRMISQDLEDLFTVVDSSDVLMERIAL